MRKCLRCQTEMVENLNIMVTNGSYSIDVREKGLFKLPLAKVKCAACPTCGHVETYLDNTDGIRELVEKNKQ